MIIVLGHLVAAAGLRDELVAASAEAVRLARAADGCLDFAVSADALDPDRVNVAERWRDRASLDAFRGSGPDDDTSALIVAFEVEEFDVTG